MRSCSFWEAGLWPCAIGAVKSAARIAPANDTRARFVFTDFPSYRYSTPTARGLLHGNGHLIRKRSPDDHEDWNRAARRHALRHLHIDLIESREGGSQPGEARRNGDAANHHLGWSYSLRGRV